MKKLALLALLLAAYLFPLAAQEEHSFSDNAIDSVISEAKKHLGVPYRWGGKNPKGFDCAGFTHYVYGKFGVNLAVSAGPQYNQGTKVKLSELSVGDLVFFGNNSVGHVALCTGPGRIIHSSQIVRENSLIEGEPDYYGRNILHVRRILSHMNEGELPAVYTKDSPAYFK